MKRLIFLAIAMVGTFGFAFAQEQKANTGQETAKVSTLEWVNTEVNLGEVPKGIPVTATYKFVNNGEQPVLITKVKTSCGCTGRTYPKEPIKPGEKAEITATYNAARVGNFNKSVTVTTNEGVSPKVLRIKGTVSEKTTDKVAK